MKYIKLVLIITLIFSALPPVEAQSTLPWIEKYTIINYRTGQTVLDWSSDTGQVLQNAPVLAGDEYKITFTLNVRQTVDNAVLTLTLTNFMSQQSEATYWQVGADFPRTSDFNPATRTIGLHHNQGIYEISVVGKISSDATVYTGEGVTLHKPLEIVFVQLDGPQGTDYGDITATVIDSKIDDYRFLLSQKQAELESYKAESVDPAYIDLYENFVALAQQQAEQGLVDSAMDLLNTLTVEVPPVETGPSWQEQYFLPAVGGLALIAAIGILLFIRTNSRLGFTKMVVEDQIREMEALQSRASRIDRNLAQRLDEINTRLKETENA
jgi:hypothetical protein